jgi:hypothetical protein
MVNGLNISEGALKAIQSEPHLRNVAAAFSKYFRTNQAWIESAKKGEPQHAYLYLRPVPDIAEQFTINREVLCAAEESNVLDGRTFEAVEKLLTREKARLESDVVFLISDARNASAMAKDYMERSGRKIIQCSWRDIEAAHEDFPYELLRRFLYSRDFFDVSDPVSADGQFFARYRIVDEIFDTLSSGQSAGIFGLRKIGKTSVLETLSNRNTIANKFRLAKLDAQMPEIYASNAAGVALEICRAFNRSWAAQHNSPFKKDIPKDLNLVDSARYFRDFVQDLSAQNKPLLVVFDELERILPHQSKINVWNTEYIDLWRLLRSESQTMGGKFVFLVASTNPYFIESAQFAGEDNPIYRFIKPTYLPMFSIDDLSDMLRKLGKPMGVTFTDDALRSIHAEFGGHPFLSRQLCSAISKDLAERPLEVNSRNVEKSIERHASSFRGDIDAILKVFADFYPEERSLLDALGADERQALKLLEEQPLAAKHLLGYGLLSRTRNSYRFTMSALPPYLKSAPTPEFKQSDIPDSVRKRHLELQQFLNDIEPALRNLVLSQLMGTFGKDWKNELKLQPAAQHKIELLGAPSNQAIMEETYITDLTTTIARHWNLFSKIFQDRTDFREQGKYLGEAARSMADHRKFEVCADDARYLRAAEACRWFARKIL